MTMSIVKLEQSWSTLEPLLTIRNETAYQRSIEQLNRLVDLVGTDEQHPLYSLLDTLGILIEAYETEHVDIPEASGVDVLQYLLEDHGLTPADLPELGNPDDVSAILSGKQGLNVQQIRNLSQRFRVSPAVFI